MSMGVGVAGQILADRYRLITLLGRGGMGAVWYAEHTSLGTPVAVKLIHPDLAKRPGMLTRFHREAQAAAKLRSVNVVQILDHGVDEGIPYIAMECLEGESLADRLASVRTLTPTATAEVMAGVCRALLRAHRLGIVHRDLKPDNIFLAREETTTVVKVLDFGIAKILDDAAAVDESADTEAAALRTETGALLGTPRYMSPEQARGRTDIDARSDLWSLAVIVFECLTGARPFTATSTGELILQICSDPIPAPSTLGDVPDGFDAWFARATQRAPAERFETVREFADALADVLTPGERWLDRERDVGAPGAAASVRGAQASRSAASRDATPATGPGRATEQPASAPMRRSPAFRIALGAAAAAVIAGGVVAARAALRASSGAPPPVGSTAPGAGHALAAPDSVLACPVLEAEGVYAPSGWLGAAVAQHLCQRATWLLGGRTERTRIPAELLGLTPTPSKDAPIDPFGAPDARERTLATAKQRSSAYLDGRVVRSPAGYDVSLRIVDASSGVGSAVSNGHAADLFAASDQALAGLLAGGDIPRVPLDPEIVRVYDFTTAEAAWVFDDNGPHRDVGALCAHVAEHAGELRAVAASIKECAGKHGLPAEPPPLDPTTVGTLVMTTVANVGRADVLARARPLLEEKLRAEALPEGKALLIEALAIARMGDSPPDELEQLMMEAVRASPRAVDWSLLLALSTAQSRVAIARAAHAWNAREPYPPWVDFGLNDGEALPLLRRSWELYGFAGEILPTYAKAAIVTGHRAEASALAGACRAGPAQYRPVGEAISARLDIEDGRFAAGEKRLLAAVLDIDGYSASDWRSFSPLYGLLAIARVLRDERRVADAVTNAFILADPPRVKLTSADDPMLALPLLNFCAGASPELAERCFARFDDWKRQGKLPKSELLDAQLAGGRAFAKGDVPGALKAWRPLFRIPGAAVLLPFDALLKVDPDLTFDVGSGDTVTQFLGVPVSAARDAKRAARKGDPKKARELAELVIGKWRDVDAEVPAVEEMKRLLVTLK